MFKSAGCGHTFGKFNTTDIKNYRGIDLNLPKMPLVLRVLLSHEHTVQSIYHFVKGFIPFLHRREISGISMFVI